MFTYPGHPGLDNLIAHSGGGRREDWPLRACFSLGQQQRLMLQGICYWDLDRMFKSQTIYTTVTPRKILIYFFNILNGIRNILFSVFPYFSYHIMQLVRLKYTFINSKPRIDIKISKMDEQLWKLSKLGLKNRLIKPHLTFLFNETLMLVCMSQVLTVLGTIMEKLSRWVKSTVA